MMVRFFGVLIKLGFCCFLYVSFIPSLAQDDSENSLSDSIKLPYEWMRDVTSDRVQQWLAEQEASQEEIFKKSDFQKFDYVLTYGKNETFIEQTKRYNFTVSSTISQPPKLKYYKSSADPEIWTLLDCEDFKSNNNDYPNIENFWVTQNDLFLVAAISHSGKDWHEFLVYDLTNRVLLEKLDGILRPSIILGENGYYYERFDTPTDLKSKRTNQRIAFHQIGTEQSEDKNIFVNADPTSIRTFDFTVSTDSKTIWLFHPVKIAGKWKEAISKMELAKSSIPKPFLLYSSPNKVTFSDLLVVKDSVYVRTDLRDPNFEVLKFSTKQVNKFSSFIPANDLVLKDFTYLNDQYFGLKYSSNGKYLAAIVDKKGQVKKKLNTFSGATLSFDSRDDEEARCYIRSYIMGANYERINLKDLTTEFVQLTRFNRAYEWDPYKYSDIKVTSYESRDGTQVPITIITNKKRYKKGSDAPALIKVYGGYGIGDEPRFDWENYFFVQNGGVLVFPGVRGGGAKGSDWGLAGRGLNKQNTIDDVISAAEFLINEKYVSAGRVILEGGSHGGFVVAAAGVQRPDLFSGVIASVGVFDLISNVDESVGHAELNRVEFGDPTDSLTWVNRMKLSPIHNLEKGVKYPSFLLLTGKNDTRVAPSQSYRFLAALKEKSGNPGNFLIVTSGGHYLTNQPDETLEIMSVKFKFLWLLTDYKFWKRY